MEKRDPVLTRRDPGSYFFIKASKQVQFWVLTFTLLSAILNESHMKVLMFRGSSMAEQPAVNRQVVGSSPTLGAIFTKCAGVVELVDTWDLKSYEKRFSYRFESGLRYHFVNQSNDAGQSRWQLVGLITRRSGVQVPLPQPLEKESKF